MLLIHYIEEIDFCFSIVTFERLFSLIIINIYFNNKNSIIKIKQVYFNIQNKFRHFECSMVHIKTFNGMQRLY